MKLSLSLPDADVAYLDEYAQLRGLASRSAVVHEAVRLLRATDLGAAYKDAWRDWSEYGDADLWDATSVIDSLKSL